MVLAVAGAGFAQLSPEKQAAYQKLAEAYYNKTAQTRAAVGVKRAELNAVAVAQNPDTAKIESLSQGDR
jgi:zinc resistance-associated protein